MAPGGNLNLGSLGFPFPPQPHTDVEHSYRELLGWRLKPGPRKLCSEHADEKRRRSCGRIACAAVTVGQGPT